MKIFEDNIPCPTCQGPMTPSRLHCQPCGTSVEGSFKRNEFASLNEEQLHFLRLFVLHEGRIRDLEKSLGISYPSVKAKVASLKAALHIEPVETNEDHITATLEALEAGDIDVDTAIANIRKDK